MSIKKQVTQSSNILSFAILVLFILVSTILPFFSFEGYSIVSNTTSHLGAQGSPHAWIMNMTFIILGMRSIQLTSRNSEITIAIFGFVFGLSLMLTGVFRNAPLIEGISIDTLSDTMHSILATTTGFSFTLMAFASFFTTKSNQRWIALLLVVIATIVPLTMMVYPSIMGVTQRFMFISSFTWIFFGTIGYQTSKNKEID